MPKFRRTWDDQIIEVDEDHANQVVRKNPKYEEVKCPSSDAPKTESEDGSGAKAASATQAPTQKKKPASKGKQSTRPKTQSKSAASK